MKRVIVCTAGHVDHGKTRLVQALTGIDCDTHPEEKARGITINPGFAHLDLPAGEQGEAVRIGMVDVPGHHRFIRNMLAGASAVDLAMLVVAVDDGVMPQTREHVALLELLGTHHGLVALTKIDIADPDLVELAVAEVGEFLSTSFLADAEIVPVSAVTGAGLDDLRAAIARALGRVAERSHSGAFRMYIDRIFSVAGFGTVVTGSIMGGTVRVDDSLFVLPGEVPVRVRRIECHGAEVPEAHGGERASLNLSGIGRADFERGMLLANRPLPVTQRIDAELTLIGEQTSLERHAQALFYTGTHETSCQIHLLDRPQARPGERVLAQLDLVAPTALLAEDRFVLRSASADQTIGGGRCVDPAPLHHRRPTERAVAEVRRRASENLVDRVVAEVNKRITFVSVGELATILHQEPAVIAAAIAGIPAIAGVRHFTTAAGDQLLGRIAAQKLSHAIREVVTQYHQDDPLGTRGVTLHQVASKLVSLPPTQRNALTEALLEDLTTQGVLRHSERGGYLLADFVFRDAATLALACDVARERFRAAGTNVVVLADLEAELTGRFRLTARDTKAIVRHLVEEGDLVAIDDAYLSTQLVARCRRRLLEHLSGGATVSVSEFRDLIDGNRKICLMLLGLFDREGLTQRSGDQRRITEKGRAALRTETASA